MMPAWLLSAHQKRQRPQEKKMANLKILSEYQYNIYDKEQTEKRDERELSIRQGREQKRQIKLVSSQ